MRERRTWIASWVLALSIACAQPAFAEGGGAPSEEDKREASAHFHRGAELFQEGVYRAALVELQRAYEIVPNYRVLYNIGQTQVALGEFVEAKRTLEAFLAQGGTAIDAKRRAEIEAQLSHLEKRIATLLIEADRSGAEVLVNGAVVGTTPLSSGVPVNVGRQRIEARTADGASASVEIDVAGGDRTSVRLVLVSPTPVVVAAPAPLSPPRKPERTLPTRTRWAIGLLSSAGAVAIAGGITALLSRSAHDDYESALRRRPGDPSDIEEARDRLSRRAIAADVLFGTAIAAGVTGAVLLFTSRAKGGDEEAEAEVRVGLAPRGLVAEGRF